MPSITTDARPSGGGGSPRAPRSIHDPHRTTKPRDRGVPPATCRHDAAPELASSASAGARTAASRSTCGRSSARGRRRRSHALHHAILLDAASLLPRRPGGPITARRWPGSSERRASPALGRCRLADLVPCCSGISAHRRAGARPIDHRGCDPAGGAHPRVRSLAPSKRRGLGRTSANWRRSSRGRGRLLGVRRIATSTLPRSPFPARHLRSLTGPIAAVRDPGPPPICAGWLALRLRGAAVATASTVTAAQVVPRSAPPCHPFVFADPRSRASGRPSSRRPRVASVGRVAGPPCLRGR